MLSLSLILLKRLYCNIVTCFKSAEVFTFVNMCQKEALIEGRQLMKWVVIFQMRIFWVAHFSGGIFQGEFNGWEFFGWEFLQGEIFIELSSSCNVSILIFQKIINKYNMTFNKRDIYFKLFLNSFLKFLSHNVLSKWVRNIFNLKHVKKWKFRVVNKWGSEKNVKTETKRTSSAFNCTGESFFYLKHSLHL